MRIWVSGQSWHLDIAALAIIQVKHAVSSSAENGHDPYAYLKDVFTRQPMSRIEELPPHRWTPATN